MSVTSFWSIKDHIQHWVDQNELTKVAVVGATPGSKTAEIVLLGDMDHDDFIKKYPMLETEYMKGYPTRCRYSKSRLTISFRRKK